MGEEVAVDAPGVRDDDHFSSVCWVDLAADESACFEPVDYACDGPGGQAGEVGEPSCGGRPVEEEEAERAEVRWVHADVFGRFVARDEQLDDEVAQVQLQVADSFLPAGTTSLSSHVISVN